MAEHTPRHKFHRQVHHAKTRGIQWLLTFDEWWAIWQASGKWEMRGRSSGDYVMARRGDVGPYSKENVFICLGSENTKQAWDAGRIPPPPSNFGKGRGWTFSPGYRKPYRVIVSGKRIGGFLTPEEADAAYRAGVAEVEQQAS